MNQGSDDIRNMYFHATLDILSRWGPSLKIARILREATTSVVLLFGDHLPIQNLEKISPIRSTVVVEPITLPSQSKAFSGDFSMLRT